MWGEMYELEVRDMPLKVVTFGHHRCICWSILFVIVNCFGMQKCLQCVILVLHWMYSVELTRRRRRHMCSSISCMRHCRTLSSRIATLSLRIAGVRGPEDPPQSRDERRLCLCMGTSLCLCICPLEGRDSLSSGRRRSALDRRYRYVASQFGSLFLI